MNTSEKSEQKEEKEILEIPFDYRFYKKKSKFICLRSIDGERHFTLVHVADKNLMTNTAWNKVNHMIKEYLDDHDWKLTFTPWKACENCTYGYFEPEFDKLIYAIREEYKDYISTDHDILNYDDQYVIRHGKPGNMFAHISHSRGSNQELCKFLQKADKDTQQLVLNITVRAKRSD